MLDARRRGVVCIVPTSKLGEMFTVKMMEGMLIFYNDTFCRCTIPS